MIKPDTPAKNETIEALRARAEEAERVALGLADWAGDPVPEEWREQVAKIRKRVRP